MIDAQTTVEENKSDLRLERARWWAVCFIHCARGRVRGLHFGSDRTRAGVMLSGGMRGVLVKNVRLAGAGPNAVAVRADEAAGEDVRTE